MTTDTIYFTGFILSFMLSVYFWHKEIDMKKLDILTSLGVLVSISATTVFSWVGVFIVWLTFKEKSNYEK